MATIAIFESMLPPWSGSDTTVVCPACETTLDVGAERCPRCEAAVLIECRACGGTIRTKMAVCPDCGGTEYETFLLE